MPDRKTQPPPNPTRICLCSPLKDAYSETFIRAHIQHLPVTLPLYGGWPLWEWEGRRIIPAAYRVGMRYGGQMYSGLEAVAERRALRYLAKFLRKHADVVLAEYGDTAAELVEPCRLAGVPLVAHFHGYDASHRETLRQHAEAYRRLFAGAAAVVAVSRAMERQLLSLGAPPERLFYNPCGVDVQAFAPTDASANPPLFVSVGRFVDKKAPYLTLAAFQQVARTCPEAKLSFAGEGPLLEACRQLAWVWGLSDRVTFQGKLGPAEVAALLSRARAFILHSIIPGSGDSEGTPVSLLEAGATALPVVATRHGGIPDVVVDRETGMLVEERDVAGMAECMITLANDPRRAGEMGQRARERIAAHYSMEVSIGNLRRIIERSLSEDHAL